MDQVKFARGVALFNSGDFFEAHEELEDVWRECRDPEKKFVQALIQSAVALHHHSRGNLVGAKSLLLRSSQNLQNYPMSFMGIDLDRLRRDLDKWTLALGSGSACPALPHLEFDKSADQRS